VDKVRLELSYAVFARELLLARDPLGLMKTMARQMGGDAERVAFERLVEIYENAKKAPPAEPMEPERYPS
jgi:hypothetical protein